MRAIPKEKNNMALDIRENVALAPYTTFEIGAEARYFIDVWSEDDMREALVWAKEKGIRHMILSGGSNVLAPGENFEAVVIHIVGDWHENKEGLIDAWTGTTLLDLIRVTGMDGWGGWEKLAGIPGTIGGAVRGNAGAFGPEIKDFVTKVRALNVKNDEMREFSNAECDFSYRQSIFKQNP